MKRININESQLYLINEINHLAEKSNVTICSLEDFISMVSSMGINDGNVEQYSGQYCFIEIGSTLPRLEQEVPISIRALKDENGVPYSAKDFFDKYQFYFSREYTNVKRMIFDDTQKFGENGKPTTAFVSDRNLTDAARSMSGYKGARRGYQIKYTGGQPITMEMIIDLKKFVETNLSINPNVKFIIHCRYGESRSAAVGICIAKKINQFNDDFLSDYDDLNDNSNPKNQFIKISQRSGKNKHPHKEVLKLFSKAEKDNGDKSWSGDWHVDLFSNHPITGYNAARERFGFSKR